MTAPTRSASPVTVIVPVRNGEATLRRAVLSVASQGPLVHEILVVDDASTDATPEVLRELARDHSVRWIRVEAGIGPGGARNLALDDCRTPLAAFLDADDWWEAGRLEVLHEALERTGATIVADPFLEVEVGSGRVLRRRHEPADGEPRWIGPEQLVERRMGAVKPLLRLEFLRRRGVRFDAGHSYGEDLEFLMLCLLKGARFLLLPRALYRKEVGSGTSLTSGRLALRRGLVEVHDAMLRWPELRARPALLRKVRGRRRRHDLAAWALGIAELVAGPRWSR